MNSKTRKEYLELFPFENLRANFYLIEINKILHTKFDENLRLEIGSITKKVHALMHKSEMLRRRYSSSTYWARARGYFPNRFDICLVDMGNFPKSKFKDRFFVSMFSNIIGIIILKKLLDFLFFYEYSKNNKLPKDIISLLVPYTGGISCEWDFLVWFGNRINCRTIAVQENWDNLSSKQFLFQHPKFFATWSKQSSSHLRTIHSYKGFTCEIGNVRVQDFYNNRVAVNPAGMASNNVELFFKKKILIIGVGDEQSDLRLLTTLSESFKKLEKTCKIDLSIIYRKHPYHFMSEKTWECIKTLPFINANSPSNEESNSERVNQVQNSDIIVSLFSTVILEASILNKTCIIPSFVLPSKNYNPRNLIDDFHHYSGMSLLHKLHVAETLDDFLHLVFSKHETTKYLENDTQMLEWFCKDSNPQAEILKLLS